MPAEASPAMTLLGWQLFRCPVHPWTTTSQPTDTVRGIMLARARHGTHRSRGASQAQGLSLHAAGGSLHALVGGVGQPAGPQGKGHAGQLAGLVRLAGIGAAQPPGWVGQHAEHVLQGGRAVAHDLRGRRGESAQW